MLTSDASPPGDGPASGRTRILLSVHSAKAGGAERMALAEAAHLAPTHDLVISVPSGPLRAQFAAHGELIDGTTSAPLWGAPAWRWAGRGMRALVQAVRLSRTIRRQELDLVLTNSSVSVAPVLAARLAGVPAIVHVRDVPASKLAPLVFRLHRALSHTVIVISTGLESYFHGSRGARVVMIPEGVEVPERNDRERRANPKPIVGRPLRLCVVGGVHPRKGQDIAIQAIASLQRSGLDVELDLVGREIDSGFATHLRDLATRLGVNERVRFIGELPDVRDHLRAVDIVVSPSRAEWTPLSIMEAMAEQKPVVAADVGSVSDVVVGGVTGIVVPPEDPESLSAAVSDLALDPERMSAMASEGRRLIEERYDITATLATLADEIAHALVPPRHGPGQKLTVRRAVKKPLSVGLFGHFGSLNSGNESTLIAMLAHLRSLSPDGRFRCICTNPGVVAARYGIEAVPITSRPAPIWDRRVSLSRRVPTALFRSAAELRQYGRAFRYLRDTDMLIVPGTGLVTDAFGLSGWGPYGMFKWTLMAKLRRCKVLIVSVGAGPIDRTLGRILFKAVLALADYRSYRDAASRDYLRAIGVSASRDQVYPDLVFSLPDAVTTGKQGRPASTRRVVGLGLMEYYEKFRGGDFRPDTYTAYLETMASFASWLLAHGYDIRLLLGDADTTVIDDFRSILEARSGPHDENRIIDHPLNSVEDLLSELATTELVVATRFHNVLLSLLLRKPVIALSFHHKCSSLMDQMKLSEYCYDIAHIEPDGLIARFQQLERSREAVKRTIDQGVDEARVALKEQYDLLFAHR